ncbi:homeobox protein ceh-28-like [Mesocricetus auratus]|uniref:Homeobox protein ceh-28-like n=1 Tax=Mesocricetus auratus TaxID=10036 RepID=A0ABM2WJF5_MESAU|nr:homeobox protein ceh-28-like [Mesocricetus auratus]
MLPHPLGLQKDPVSSRNLGHQLHPDLQVSSNAHLETGVQVPDDPEKKSSLHMSQSPLKHSGAPMQPSPSNHPSHVSKQSLQKSQSLQEELLQTTFKWLLDSKSSLCPQLTSVPPPEPRLPVHQGSPTLGTRSTHPNHQMLSSSSVNSACKCSLGSMFPSYQYGDKQVCNAVPRKQRKERTVYTKEQKLLLQEHFDQCMNPSFDQRKELALMVGVTEQEIKNWFKNHRARYKLKKSQTAQEGQPEKL